MKNAVAVLVLLLPIACQSPPESPEFKTLNEMLEPYLAKYELPAVAAAVVKDGQILSAGAVGTRRYGQEIPVTINDTFHLGSDTKAMTALLAAMLVEEGELKWSSTVADIFPEMDQMDSNLRGVTLEQLLSHTSGVAGDNEDFGDLLAKSASQEGNLDELRHWLVTEWGKLPQENKPGSGFAYSNMNYVITGAMIERRTGRTWDELITERIFVPLGLATAGLGNQASIGKIDAPLAHCFEDGKVKVWLSGPSGDNPPIIGPAGIAYMSVLDFARWAGWNAAGGTIGPDLVTPATLLKLHTPVTSMPTNPNAAPGTPSHGKYALGWGRVTVEWAPDPLVYHGGSNGKNLAHIWVDRNRSFGIVTLTNVGGNKAQQALLSIASTLYPQFANKDE